jgi:hypothetical protein
MQLHERGQRPRSICRECRALHGAKDCPRRKAQAAVYGGFGVLTMREEKLRSRLERQYGCELTWEQVFQLRKSAV